MESNLISENAKKLIVANEHQIYRIWERELPDEAFALVKETERYFPHHLENGEVIPYFVNRAIRLLSETGKVKINYIKWSAKTFYEHHFILAHLYKHLIDIGG